MPFADLYRGRRVLVTGHTGFKGSWLCEWLLDLGAEVTGLALAPPSTPALFDQLNLAARLQAHITADVRDLSQVTAALEAAKPEVIFHLAAQSLVRASYAQPVETYDTNIMGTVHVLEAIRQRAAPCAVVTVTSDKCYENREWVYSYREEDPMGGYDPYSSSKGAAELVVAAYRRSFFAAGGPVQLASARAGNVIGGGDWAQDRIVPDCIRSLTQDVPIVVRNRKATRPWQHVLEPLSGYLLLGAALLSGANAQRRYSTSVLESGFNFGPALSSNRTVEALVEEVLKHWPGLWEDLSDPNAVHEASLLNLSTDKAHHVLAWRPVWDFAETVRKTIAWYRAANTGDAIPALTRAQISSYVSQAESSRIGWAS